ncbi:MAG: hypothetical protein ACLR5S_08660 [Ruminococcus sp.]
MRFTAAYRFRWGWHFVLQNAGYCIDVFRGKCRGETNWRRLGLYLLFYPRLIMGPVVPYPMVHKTICDPAFDMSRIGGGLLRFLVGMAKKLFLADWVGMLFQTLCQTSDAPYSMLVVWLGAFSQLVTLYLELSSYADMAIGIGACYGVRLPESYGKSLFYPSIAAFADQWNRTVVQWFSHYVGTHFRGSNRFFQLLALMITWGCIGLWYGVRLPSLLFGLLIGFCLWLAHLLWRDKRTSMLRYALTLLLLSVGAVLLTLPDLPSVWNYLKIMLCGGHIAPTEADADLLRAYGLALAAAVYSVSGNWRWLFHLVEEKPWFRILRVPLTVLFGIGALLLDVMLLVHTGGTVQMQLVL